MKLIELKADDLFVLNPCTDERVDLFVCRINKAPLMLIERIGTFDEGKLEGNSAPVPEFEPNTEVHRVVIDLEVI